VIAPPPHSTIARAALLASLLFVALLPHPLAAQTTVAAAEPPDASAFQSSRTSADPGHQGTASLSGIVVDPTVAAVAGARITLTAADGTPARTTTADKSGAFIYRNLPAGVFQVTILATAHLGSFVSPRIPLSAGEQRQLPNIVLSLASTGADISVTATQSQVAAAQVQAEMHQYALGVFPNFYSSYVWDAAPLSSKQKYVLALRTVTVPVNYVTTGFIAGIEQAKDIYPGYGQGAEGYAKRYGAEYADDFSSRLIGSAVLPSLLHQDPRYFYKGSGTVRQRVLYALKFTVFTRGDDGQTQPGYSYIFGSFASAAISTAYHPADDRGAGLILGNGFLHIAGHAADNLLREFVLRHLSNVPTTSTIGQP
jgi:hypothetical protein